MSSSDNAEFTVKGCVKFIIYPKQNKPYTGYALVKVGDKRTIIWTKKRRPQLYERLNETGHFVDKKDKKGRNMIKLGESNYKKAVDISNKKFAKYNARLRTYCLGLKLDEKIGGLFVKILGKRVVKLPGYCLFQLELSSRLKVSVVGMLPKCSPGDYIEFTLKAELSEDELNGQYITLPAKRVSKAILPSTLENMLWQCSFLNLTSELSKCLTKCFTNKRIVLENILHDKSFALLKDLPCSWQLFSEYICKTLRLLDRDQTKQLSPKQLYELVLIANLCPYLLSMVNIADNFYMQPLQMGRCHALAKRLNVKIDQSLQDGFVFYKEKLMPFFNIGCTFIPSKKLERLRLEFSPQLKTLEKLNFITEIKVPQVYDLDSFLSEKQSQLSPARFEQFVAQDSSGETQFISRFGVGPKATQFTAYYSAPSLMDELELCVRLANIENQNHQFLWHSFSEILPRNFRATPEQASALTLLQKHPISVLTGPPGSGKTETMRVLSRWPDIGPNNIVFTAPTGKAVHVLHGRVSSRCCTVDYLLTKAKAGDPTLEYIWFLVLDEASMVSLKDFLLLIRALPELKKIVLVGDKDQLPCIGMGPIFSEFTELFPCAMLTGSQRTSNKHIRLFADAVMKQDISEFPFLEHTQMGSPEDGVLFAYTSDTDKKVLRFTEYVQTNELDILDTMVIGFRRKDVNQFNMKYLKSLRTYGSTESVLSTFHPGDKIRLTKNRQAFWLDETREIRSDRVYNGEFAVIKKIYTVEHGMNADTEANRTPLEKLTPEIVRKNRDCKLIMEIWVDSKREKTKRLWLNQQQTVGFDELMYQWMHGVASTAHGTQGTSIGHVILDIPFDISAMGANRRHVYTAATRAKYGLMVVGTKWGLDKIINVDTSLGSHLFTHWMYNPEKAFDLREKLLQNETNFNLFDIMRKFGLPTSIHQSRIQ